ncbi:MAG: TetR/AcrR family transcriptional regulator, partial [Syntrophomonadaceae bacterium]|nr:TetR/AcrR family transcriptional regulator [Syntrophomonadaceae bacterium]
MKSELECLSTKEKILKVTREIIAEEGFQNITIRKIANKAGVNVAAINYYFGSKDAVINESLKTVTDELKVTFEFLKNSKEDPRTKLSIFIVNYSDMILKYPDLLKNVINLAIHNKPLELQTEYMNFMQTDGIEILKQTISEIRPELDEFSIYIKIIHLLSGLSFPFLMDNQFKKVMGFDLYNKSMREKHIN